MSVSRGPAYERSSAGGCIQVGFGPISWLLLSEIFPLRIRGMALSVGSLVNFASNIFVTMAFPHLITLLGQARARTSSPHRCSFTVKHSTRTLQRCETTQISHRPTPLTLDRPLRPRLGLWTSRFPVLAPRVTLRIRQLLAPLMMLRIR